MAEPSTRVQPRIPMEERVDRRRHPARRSIPTKHERNRERLPWHLRLSLVLLAVAWASLPLAGLLGPLLGPAAGLALGGLFVSSLIVSWLLGAE